MTSFEVLSRRRPSSIVAGLGAAVVLGIAIVASPAHSAITFFKNDYDGWKQEVGAFSTCDFTGFPEYTVIDDEYASLGILFVNPPYDVVKYLPTSCPQDQWGIDGNGIVEVLFSEPMYAIGAHVPGNPKIQLFSGSTLVGESPYFSPLSVPKFGGLISTVAFDRAKFIPITPQNGQVYMDNLYFSPIPAPASIVVLATLGLVRRRRRADGR